MKPAKKVFMRPDHVLTIYILPNGDYYREDGPSYIEEYDNGDYYEIWSLHNMIHRYDGPAVTEKNGDIEFWVNAKNVSDHANEWFSERDSKWETMTDLEKWEFELFMRSLG